MKKLLLLLVSLVVALGLNAAEYGLDKKACPVRYTVTSGEVAVRAKADMKAKRIRTVSGGDLIYVDKEERISAGGVQWVKLSGEEAYIPVRMLTVDNNPHYVHKVVKPAKTSSLVRFGFYDLPRWLAWTLLSVWIGLAFITCLIFALLDFFPPFMGYGVYPNIDKFIKDDSDYSRKHSVYGMEGMRRKLFFNKEPYLIFTYIALIFLASFVVTILLFLLIGGLVWGACWLGKILLIALYWIVLVVGYGGGVLSVLYGIFSGEGCLEQISGLVVGVLLVCLGVAIGNAQDAMYNAGTVMVGWGNKVFEVFNVFSLSLYILKTYWFTALLIAVTPLALFLVCAVLYMSFAGILILIENSVMKRYNVEHPCPICGRPSEPAVYLSHGVPLPVNLHPGVWGLFYIKHPATGEKMPTLFLRGKDRLERLCTTCAGVISANVGVEKHVAFAGVAKSGKSTLLYRVVAEMLRKKVGSESVCDFTDDLGDDEVYAKRFLKTIEDGQRMREFPGKTSDDRHKSVQLIVKNPKSLLPYRLYVNDVAGEVFTSKSNTNLENASFLKNTEVLVFVLDPFTVKSDELEYSERMKAWCEQNLPGGARKFPTLDMKEAVDTLTNMLIHYRGKKADCADVELMFTFVKTDTGYLSGVDVNDQESLKQFAIVDMGLGQVVHDLSGVFKNVTFHAVSAAESVDKSGIATFVDDIFDSLDVSFKRVRPKQLHANNAKLLAEQAKKEEEQKRFESYQPKSMYSEYGLTIGIVVAFILAIASTWGGIEVNKSLQEKNFAKVVEEVDAIVSSQFDYDEALAVINTAMSEKNLSQEHLNALAAKASAVRTAKMRHIDSMMSVLYANIESTNGRASNVEICARYGAIDNLKEIKSKIDELLKIIPSDQELQGYIEKFEKVLKKYNVVL